MRISGLIPVSQPAAPSFDSFFTFWAFFHVVRVELTKDFFTRGKY